MDQWNRRISSSLLPLAILATLAQKPSYGYDIRRRLAESHFGEFKSGTIYPLLNRLEEDGLITSQWSLSEHENPRKLISITDPGRQSLSKGLNEGQHLLQTISILSTQGES